MGKVIRFPVERARRSSSKLRRQRKVVFPGNLAGNVRDGVAALLVVISSNHVVPNGYRHAQQAVVLLECLGTLASSFGSQGIYGYLVHWCGPPLHADQFGLIGQADITGQASNQVPHQRPVCLVFGLSAQRHGPNQGIDLGALHPVVVQVDRYAQFFVVVQGVGPFVLLGDQELGAVFIALGAVAIEQISWIFYLFGIFLLYTGFSLVRDDDDDDDGENAVVRLARKRFTISEEWDGLKLTVVENGKRAMTPMLLVIIALGTTDLLFALDSIPAIYGLTDEPYLVFAANVFALMGLRQLYFLLGGLLKKLIYLSQGLALLLSFIGVKLILHALHENELPFINGGEHVPVPEISTVVSIAVIVGILSVTAIVSLTVSSRREKAGLNDDGTPAASVEPSDDNS